MQDLIASGRVADIVLAVMAFEGLFLILRLRPDRRALAGLVGNLTGGAALVVALRFALTAAGWPWIAGALLVAMAAHAVDLAVRLGPR